MSYTIFDHAQHGHVTPQPPTPSVVPPPEPQPTVVEPQREPVVTPQPPERQPLQRKRHPAGWAVEAGLGLGPQFRGKR